MQEVLDTLVNLLVLLASPYCQHIIHVLQARRRHRQETFEKTFRGLQVPLNALKIAGQDGDVFAHLEVVARTPHVTPNVDGIPLQHIGTHILCEPCQALREATCVFRPDQCGFHARHFRIKF
jgi:hypothetical protein